MLPGDHVFRQLVLQVDVLGGDKTSGAFKLFRGDHVIGLRVSLQPTAVISGAGANGLPALGDVTIRLAAFNDPFAVGVGIGLPDIGSSQLEIMRIVGLPATDVHFVSSAFNVATGASTDYKSVLSYFHDLPLSLRVDETTRDVCWEITTQNTPLAGYVALIVANLDR